MGSGSTVTMEFTVTNTSSDFPLTDIAFTDSLGFLSGVAATSLPAAGYCGAGAQVFQSDLGGNPTLSFSGGSLPAGGSCTFSVDLLTPSTSNAGAFVNETSAVTATLDGETVSGAPASDTLELVGGLSFRKEFIDDPVGPGDTATVRYTIGQDEEAVGTATGIAFTDDLTAALAGLEAVGLPAIGVCGPGSQISGTTNLSLTGGSLVPGEVCEIDVTVTVPAAATPGSYAGTTSNLMATVSGVDVITPGAVGTLDIAGLELTLEYIDDPVIAGAPATLRYTITNLSPTLDATDMLFTQNLTASLAGLAAAGLPALDVCGAGSQIQGTSFLVFLGGNLLAGDSCTFDVTVDVPAGAASGLYSTSTSNLTATLGGGSAAFDPGTAVLEVSSELLGLSKAFLEAPVGPGGLVTLEFTVDNMADAPATDIAFTDDLDA
ncbi:MAG: hypothetical protein AAFX50_20335, partial [Acidobacteriota bacterium]